MPELQPAGIEAVIAGLDTFLAGIGAMNKAVSDFGEKANDLSESGNSFIGKSVAWGTFIGQLGAEFAKAGIEKVGQFFSSAIESAQEGEISTIRLSTAIGKLGSNTKITVDEAADLADKLADLSGRSSDTEKAAEAIILGFRHINTNIFPRTMQLTNDLAAGMGSDLPTAAETLGKALENPKDGLGALSRAGITFTDGQAAMIAKLQDSGKLLQAQGMILDQVQSKYGGLSDILGGTLTGRLTALSNKWDDFKGKLGESFSPAIAKIIDALILELDSLIKELDRLSTDPTFIYWSARITAAIVVVIEGFSTLTGVIAQSMGLIVQIVAKAAMTVYTLLQLINPFARHSPSLVESVEIGVDQIIDAYSRIRTIEGTMDSAADAIARLGDAARRAGKDDLETLQGAAEDAKRVVGDLNQQINDLEQNIRDLAGSQIEGEQAVNDQTFALQQQLKQAQLNKLQMQDKGATKEELEAADKQVEAIQRQIDILRLQSELKFDPLHKQIKELAEPIHEMPFDAIITGIKSSQDLLAQSREKLEPAIQAYDTLAKAVEQLNKKIAEQSAGGGGGGGVALEGIPKPEDFNLPDFSEWTKEFDTAKEEYNKTIKPLFEDINKKLQTFNQALEDSSKAIDNWEGAWDRDTKTIMKHLEDFEKAVYDDLNKAGTHVTDFMDTWGFLAALLAIPLQNPFLLIIEAIRTAIQLIERYNQLMGNSRSPTPGVGNVPGQGASSQQAPQPTGPERDPSLGGGGLTDNTSSVSSASTAYRPVYAMSVQPVAQTTNYPIGPIYVRSEMDVHSLAYNVKRYNPAPSR